MSGDRPADRAAITREAPSEDGRRAMTIRDAQALIEKMYSHKDRARGSAGTFLWLMEEVGELASSLASGDPKAKAGEFADVFAWLLTLANVECIDLDRAFAKYASGCPGCGQMACTCGEKP